MFAAASLSDAFTQMAEEFEAANPGLDVQLSIAGSSVLRDQIVEGAPADVFASANESTMEAIVAAGEASGTPRVFSENLLTIAVPDGNPGAVAGLEDFAEADLLLGLCAEGVPCGDFARDVLAGAGVVPALDTAEPDVRALLTKIGAGELDAGIVYATDVIAAGDSVEGIVIPDEYNMVAGYPIVTLTDAPNPTGAAAFVSFVLGASGRSILQAHGFLVP